MQFSTSESVKTQMRFTGCIDLHFSDRCTRNFNQYSVCLISISDYFFDRTTQKISSEYWKIIARLTLNNDWGVWARCIEYPSCENSTFYKECMNLLRFCHPLIFKTKFLLANYKFHHVQRFTSSLTAWSQIALCLTCCFLYAKHYDKTIDKI